MPDDRQILAAWLYQRCPSAGRYVHTYASRLHYLRFTRSQPRYDVDVMLNFIYLACCNLPERRRCTPEQEQHLAVWIDRLIAEGDPLGRWLQLDKVDALDPVEEHDAIRSRFVREFDRLITEQAPSYRHVNRAVVVSNPWLPPDFYDRLTDAQREE